MKRADRRMRPSCRTTPITLGFGCVGRSRRKEGRKIVAALVCSRADTPSSARCRNMSAGCSFSSSWIFERVRGVRAARIEQSEIVPRPPSSIGVPAKKLHQHIARLGGRRPGEERRDNFLERKSVRAGQDEPRRALLQKQFLQRRQLVQDRLLDRLRQFAQKTFEALDDVEKGGPIHSDFGSQ